MTDEKKQNARSQSQVHSHSKIANESQLVWIRKMLQEHPALLLSAMYFVASLIGLVFSWDFLRFFNINVFRYAEISDFLLASLKEPFTWLMAVTAVALVLLDNSMSRRVEASGPGRFVRWYGTPRYRQINVLVMIILVGFFLHTFAVQKETRIRSGRVDLVTVTLADGSEPRQLTMLGTTGRFVFFYDSFSEQVFIHPHESIQVISKAAPARRR